MSRHRYDENAPKKGFDLGMIVITSGAQQVLSPLVFIPALARHARGDWGDLDEEDWAANERAYFRGERLFSCYEYPGAPKFYIITEHDHSVTTILLPQEY